MVDCADPLSLGGLSRLLGGLQLDTTSAPLTGLSVTAPKLCQYTYVCCANIIIIMYNLILVKSSLLVSLDRGLARRVSGETPKLPVVSFVLLRDC